MKHILTNEAFSQKFLKEANSLYAVLIRNTNNKKISEKIRINKVNDISIINVIIKPKSSTFLDVYWNDQPIGFSIRKEDVLNNTGVVSSLYNEINSLQFFKSEDDAKKYVIELKSQIGEIVKQEINPLKEELFNLKEIYEHIKNLVIINNINEKIEKHYFDSLSKKQIKELNNDLYCVYIKTHKNTGNFLYFYELYDHALTVNTEIIISPVYVNITGKKGKTFEIINKNTNKQLIENISINNLNDMLKHRLPTKLPSYVDFDKQIVTKDFYELNDEILPNQKFYHITSRINLFDDLNELNMFVDKLKSSMIMLLGKRILFLKNRLENIKDYYGNIDNKITLNI